MKKISFGNFPAEKAKKRIIRAMVKLSIFRGYIIPLGVASIAPEWANGSGEKEKKEEEKKIIK